MKRIATANRAVDLFGAGKDGFKAAVPGVSEPTYCSAEWFNYLQEAIVRTIEAAGLEPSDDYDQFANALTIVTTAQATRAEVALVATELARDAALIQAGVYMTEALGRAAVADGVSFKVQGSGDVAAYEYRRTSSTASALIASYPSVAAVKTLQDDGLDVRHVDAPTAGVFAVADLDGKLLFDITENGDLVSPHIARIDAKTAAQAGINAAGTVGLDLIYAMTDSAGRVLLAQQADGDPYSPVRDLRILALENGSAVAALRPLHLIVVYGQSNAQGDVSFSQTWRVPMVWGTYPPGYAGEMDGASKITTARTGDTWTLAADRASLVGLTASALGSDYGEGPVHGLVDSVATHYPDKQFCVFGHGVGGQSLAYLDKPTTAEITAGAASGITISAASAEYLMQTAGKTMASILDYAYATCATPYYQGMWIAAKTAALAASIGSRLYRADMVWLQGENDYTNAAYEAELQAFWVIYSADLMLATGQTIRPCMIVEESNYSGTAETPSGAGYIQWVASGYTDTSAYTTEAARVNTHAALNTRQLTAVESGLYASPRLNMYLAAPRYPVASRIHMHPHAARNHGEQLGKVYAKVVLEGASWVPLKPLSVWFDAAHIYIRFAVPKAPLQLVIPPQGTTHHLKVTMSYGLEHSAGTIQAANVKVMGGDVIRITPDVAPASGQTLGYVQSARYGSLCDSDTTPAVFTDRTGAANVSRNYCVPFIITL
ncbi:MAG: hypothetical protein Q8Q81_00390 [Oxalobacteraceae bacterium]|nr:hypothetical protein [Oxalobacteraceae bacterium]